MNMFFQEKRKQIAMFTADTSILKSAEKDNINNSVCIDSRLTFKERDVCTLLNAYLRLTNLSQSLNLPMDYTVIGVSTNQKLKKLKLLNEE